MRFLFLALIFSWLLIGCSEDIGITTDDGTRLILKTSDLSAGTHHTRHAEIFGKYIDGYNLAILEGIDKVQATADSGGGYFTGIRAVPTESPIGYPLQLFEKNLIDPPRKTSYCSGSSYSAFIEGMNILLQNQPHNLDSAHFESLRMQEMDGGRREDHIKFWGKWNADGYGNHFALVQYAAMGKVVKPVQARPGDFLNISWKNGGGHSVIFLGWYLDPNQEKKLLYWSSQKRTNGFGDDLVSIDRIREVMVVRLSQPQRIYDFDLSSRPDQPVSGDMLKW